MQAQGEETLPSRSSTPGRTRSAAAVAANGAPPRTGSTPVQPAADLPPSSQSSTPQQDTVPLPRPPSVYAPVPSHVPRFSLSDKPSISTASPPPPNGPSVVVDDVSTPQTPSEETPVARTPSTSLEPDAAPAVQSSLAALKKSDVLERRASKRFSTYNISKMTGGSIRERMTSGNHGSRLSIAASGALTPGDLATLDEEDERSPSPQKRGARHRARNPSPITEDDEPPPVPPLPSREVSPNKAPRPAPPTASPPVPPPEPTALEASAETSSRTLTVFLQVGREVKKISLEPGLTFSTLRMLFVDKFSYSPGKDNFPAIYIRDPSSGVQYELEDIDEVHDKCLLSLNIERASLCYWSVSLTLTLTFLYSSRSDQAAHRYSNIVSLARYQRLAINGVKQSSCIPRRSSLLPRPTACRKHTRTQPTFRSLLPTSSTYPFQTHP